MLRSSIHAYRTGMASVKLGTRLRRLYAAAKWSFDNERDRPVSYDWFTESEVAGYDCAQSTGSQTRVDDQTWRDLGINAYLGEIGQRYSIFARQFLYRALRRGRANAAEPSLYQLRSGNSAEDWELLRATERVVDGLRCIEVDLTPLLYRAQAPVLPDWIRWLWVAPYALIYILLASYLLPSLGAWSLLAYAALVVWVQIQLYRPLKHWSKWRCALNSMANAALELAHLGRVRPHPLLEDVVANEALIASIKRSIKMPWYERIGGIAEYANLVFLYEYIQLAKNVDKINQLLPDLRTAYEIVARCEGGLAVMEHLVSNRSHCAPAVSCGRDIEFEALVHPLVKDPVPLTLVLDGRRGAFISGQNGAGKSTLLRAIGLSLLTARALGFCYARGATVPFAVVCSSMEHADSIERSESLYMAEMRRAKELVEMAKACPATVFVVDEIFRGTNNIESVSAGVAVIAQLAKNHLVVMSSHNLILAPLLSEFLIPLHVLQHHDSSQSIVVERGVMTETNGIDMMRDYLLPEEAIRQATDVFEWFSSYTIKPTNFPVVR